MQRPRARGAEELAEEVAIEPGEREPLRAARRGGHDVHVLGAEPALANDAQRVRTSAEGEGGGHGWTKHERLLRGKGARLVSRVGAP